MDADVDRLVDEFYSIRPHDFHRTTIAALARQLFGNRTDLCHIVTNACKQLGIN